MTPITNTSLTAYENSLAAKINEELVIVASPNNAESK